MKTQIIAVVLLLVTTFIYISNIEQGPIGHIEFLNPSFHQLVDTTAHFEVISEGYQWTEGPVWVEEYQFLLFSDIPGNTIYKWTKGEGVTEYLNPSGYTGKKERGGQMGSNGLMIGKDKSLYIAQHGDRRIVRMDASLNASDPTFISVADSFNNHKLNSPNDLVQHSNGGIYFTDPPYGIEKNNKKAQQLSYQGVYYLTPNGQLHLVTDKMSRPNGIALSPDEKTLYVSNSDRNNPIWMKFDVNADGKTSNGHVFMDATGSRGTGVPDGMTVDKDGNIYAAGPGGLWVVSPNAEILGRIKTDKAITNCDIGNNGKMLYVTGSNRLLRIPLK